MKKLYFLLFLSFITTSVLAQPAGWSGFQAYTVTNNSSQLVLGYQMPIIVNTQALISSSQLQANGNDVRFGPFCNQATFYPHYLDSGINTANTRFFVKIDTLQPNASKTIFMFYGNATAANTSTVTIFNGPYSSTNQVTGGAAGGVGNSQRGFRFAPNLDILVTQFGKNEPTGTTRYVTLFNFATQAIIRQMQVSGGAGTYVYGNLPQPVWLTSGTQYTVQLFQGPSDGYYFGTSSQINPNLTYYDMQYCNSCTQNSFPNSVLANYHYGYPDFNFYTRNSVTPAPTVVIGGSGGGGGITAQPASVFPCVGNSTTITAGVGSSTTSIQWQMLNGSTWTNLTNTPPYSGVTTATLSISNVTAAMNGNQYRLTVTGACGLSVSNVATLTLGNPPVPTVSSSSPLRFCEGGAVVLNTFQASGMSYQWVKDGTPIAGATGTSYIAFAPGTYTVEMTNGSNCTGTSVPVQVVVLPLPTPSINLTGNTMTTGSYTAYQWYYNTQPLAGATGQSYTTSINGPYAVAVTNSDGCSNLSPSVYIGAVGVGQTAAVTATDIRIHPNPAQSQVTIENKGYQKMDHVTILNPMGAKVFDATIDKSTVTIPVAGLAAGFYLVRIQSGEQTVIKKLEIVR